MLKNISVIHMKSTCLVCFTVELNSETLYIFNILRNHGSVALPGHEPTPNSEMENKENKEKAKPQIIKAFKRSFHYSKPQLFIFSLSLAAVSQLHKAFHPGLPPSSESQCKHPSRAGSEIHSWAEGGKGFQHCFPLV